MNACFRLEMDDEKLLILDINLYIYICIVGESINCLDINEDNDSTYADKD